MFAKIMKTISTILIFLVTLSYAEASSDLDIFKNCLKKLYLYPNSWKERNEVRIFDFYTQETKYYTYSQIYFRSPHEYRADVNVRDNNQKFLFKYVFVDLSQKEAYLNYDAQKYSLPSWKINRADIVFNPVKLSSLSFQYFIKIFIPPEMLQANFSNIKIYREKLAGKDVITGELASKFGTAKIWGDPSSALPVQIEIPFKTEDANHRLVLKLSEYKNVSGYQIPYSCRGYVDSKLAWDTQLKECQINIVIPSALFYRQPPKGKEKELLTSAPSASEKKQISMKPESFPKEISPLPSNMPLPVITPLAQTTPETASPARKKSSFWFWYLIIIIVIAVILVVYLKYKK